MRMQLATRLVVLLAVAALGACNGGSMLAPTSGQSANSVASLLSANGPRPCKGQSTTSLYSSTSSKLESKRAALCIPAFAGFGGALNYPGAHPPVSVVVTSSTTNYNHLIPTLGKGKPLFFLQIATSAGTNFGTTVSDSVGLESTSLVAGKSYDIFGEAKLAGVAGIIVPFAACKATASKGKTGGEITDIGSRMEGAKLTTPATIYLEVYPKRKSNSAC
jgi:hypothetical protein